MSQDLENLQASSFYIASFILAIELLYQKVILGTLEKWHYLNINSNIIVIARPVPLGNQRQFRICMENSYTSVILISKRTWGHNECFWLLNHIFET